MAARRRLFADVRLLRIAQQASLCPSLTSVSRGRLKPSHGPEACPVNGVAVRHDITPLGRPLTRALGSGMAARVDDPATPAPPSTYSFNELPLMMTVAEAAVVLRVSRTTAYKLAEDWRTSGGREGLPVIKLGRRLVVRRVDLAELVGLPPTD